MCATFVGVRRWRYIERHQKCTSISVLSFLMENERRNAKELNLLYCSHARTHAFKSNVQVLPPTTELEPNFIASVSIFYVLFPLYKF
jgi:hypothetical protein